MSVRLYFLAVAAAASFAHAQEVERAPFITTPSEVVRRMLGFAGTTPNDLVVDLGSGDGRIVIEAARVFGARGLGIELDPLLVEKSRENARAAKVADRVSFVHGDVLRTDISQASVVTIYLLPGLINQLQPRFLEELKPGTRIVSHAFAMAGWKPDRTETVQLASPHPGQGGKSTLFLWFVPAKVRGTWEGGDLRLRIQQNFQEVDVEATLAGVPLADVRAKLTGSSFVMRARDLLLQVQVTDGKVMGGVLTRDGVISPFALSKQR